MRVYRIERLDDAYSNRDREIIEASFTDSGVEKPQGEEQKACENKHKISRTIGIILGALNKAFNTVTTIIVALAVILLVLVKSGTVTLGLVSGTSMQPNLYAGNIMIAVKQDEFQRDDVIILRGNINTEDRLMVKRIIGLPGDVIIFVDGHVYVNGYLEDESMLDGAVTDKGGLDDNIVVVPDGALFVLGDNREVSMDSRNPLIGFIPIEDVKGKVYYVISGPIIGGTYKKMR